MAHGVTSLTCAGLLLQDLVPPLQAPSCFSGGCPGGLHAHNEIWPQGSPQVVDLSCCRVC